MESHARYLLKRLLEIPVAVLGTFALLALLWVSIQLFDGSIHAAIQRFVPYHGRRVAYNAETNRLLADLQRALEKYRSDFGTYPSAPGGALVSDTRYFVRCIRSASAQREHPYHLFNVESFKDGELLSPYSKPFRYTFPAGDASGPDGKVHVGIPYYLWTWGGLSSGPEADWEINNWSAQRE
jgi:hypothetical protein